MDQTVAPAEDKPGLLLLCQTLPWPLDGGVWLRTYNVVRLLSRRYNIRLLCFERTQRRGGQTDEEIATATAELSKYARVEVFEIPQARSRIRYVWDHLRSLLTQRVYTVYLYENAKFARRVQEILATESIDLVHIDSLDLSGYLPLLGDKPVVCVHHNAESKLLERRAQAAGSALARQYIQMQSNLQAKEERRWCPRVAMNVVVSEGDRVDLHALSPESKFSIVPNGVDTDFFPFSYTGDEQGLVFVGGLDWFPNADALQFFAEDIVPELAKLGIQPRVRWVGGFAEDKLIDTARAAGVEMPGRIDDIRPTVAESRCYIVPLRVGGGSRLKILDAWSSGKALVSTSVGCEGLDARDGENCLVADDPVAFANAIARVVQDDDLARELGRAGRETVEQIYSWERIGVDMLATYESLEPGATQP